MALIGWHLIAGHRYAAVWVSDATLWGRAVQMAPMKFRPWMNYQKALQAP